MCSELYTRTDEDPDIEVTTQPFSISGVEIPSGFRFDGASAPRFLWGVIPPFKRVKKAAVVHDYLCKTAKSMKDREEADRLFFVLLRDVAKINILRCYIGYYGVRIGAFFGVGVHYLSK